MTWPLSQDYNEAIQDPPSSLADPELKQGEAVTNALGIPMPRSGNFADVYEVKCPNGTRWAVKCFTREVHGLRERYQEISRHLQQAKVPFIVDFTYLEQGIRVRGQWYPVLKMQWVEGLTLNEFIRQYLGQPAMMEALSQIWVRMAKFLRDAQIGHCDLQHGNILLVPGSTANSVALKLIDYDGMFVPALAGKKSGEVGHPSYQHPQRLQEGIYNLEVDRFPLLLIATALRCLKTGGRVLWDKYDNGDNLLFREVDLKAPMKSHLFAELVKIHDPAVKPLVNHMIDAIRHGLETTPLLEDVFPGVNPLTALPAPARPAARPVAMAPGAMTPVVPPRIVAAPVAPPVMPPRTAIATSAVPVAAQPPRFDFESGGGGSIRPSRQKKTGSTAPWIIGALLAVAAASGLGFWAMSGSGNGGDDDRRAQTDAPKNGDRKSIQDDVKKDQPKDDTKRDNTRRDDAKKDDTRRDGKVQDVSTKDDPKEGVLPIGADGKPLNLDFETGTLKDWTAEGDAFTGQPVKGDTVAKRRNDMKSEHQGQYWIGGYEIHGDKPQGTLTSVAFKVTHPWASFLVGGGADPATCVELVRKDTGEVFHRAAGQSDETLRREMVDLRPLMGKEIFIRLVDKHSEAWGHLNFDDFRFHSDKQKNDKVRRAYRSRAGNWKLEGTTLVQSSRYSECEIVFGDFTWKDYDFTAEMKSLDRLSDFGLLYHVTGAGHELFGHGYNNEKDFVLSIGWGNFTAPQFHDNKLETNRWYKLSVRLRGTNCQCFLDGVKIFDFETKRNPRGAVGLRAHGTAVHYRNLRVTAPDGAMLFEGLPELPASAEQWPPSTEPASSSEVNCLKGHRGPVTCVTFSRDGRQVLSSSDNGIGHADEEGKLWWLNFVPPSTVRLWDVETGKQLDWGAIFDGWGIARLAIAPETPFFLSAMNQEWGGDGPMKKVRLGTIADGKLQTLLFPDNTRGVVNVGCTPNGRRALALSRTGTVWEWDMSDKKLIQKFDGSLKNTTCTALAPNGQLALLARTDKPFAEIDLATGKETMRWKEPSPGVRCLAFSPDSRQLLSGEQDGSVSLWDVASGKRVQRLRGHAGAVVAVAFSPDGRRALSGSDDYTVRLWDLEGKKELARFTGHTAGVQAVAFSPDGLRAASGGWDYTVRLWHLPPPPDPIVKGDHQYHFDKGNTLSNQAKLPEAEAAYREAIRLKRDFPNAHYNLGTVLAAQNKLAEAIAAYREAIRLKPDYAEAHCNLGHALQQLGQFREGRDARRRGHELGSKQANWRYPSESWLREAERFATLEEKLPSILRGESKPADTAERLDLARVCLPKRLNAAAARFSADAFAGDPKAADDLSKAHRYNAACAAAQAGCGKGKDALKLDDSERESWRRQAREWLKADLTLREKQLDSDKNARAIARGALQHWQKDADLAGVRDKEGLAKLPAAEREAWQKLWADVEALLKKARADVK